MTVLVAQARPQITSGWSPSALRTTLFSLLLPLALVTTWQAAVSFAWVPTTLIAPPKAVIVDLARLMLDGTLAAHAWASIARLVQGFVLGSLAGIVLGSWIGLSRRAQTLFEPTLSVLAPIPPTAWIPVLILLLGIQEASKIWLICIGVFFVVVSQTIAGIRHVDIRLVEVARVYGKSRQIILTDILLPAAMPSILGGLRTGLGLSWILLIAAELIAANKGLGWLIADARNFSRPDDMMSGMVCIGALGAISDKGMLFAQRYLLRWQLSFSGE